MTKTWLEAALNGPWQRKNQPNIPITVDEVIAEGIAAAKAGAAIVHIHAYDPDTGVQNDSSEIYAAIIEGIHAKVDAIVYPTISSATQPGSEVGVVGAWRYEPGAVLGARGMLEWSIVDPGSANRRSASKVLNGVARHKSRPLWARRRSLSVVKGF